MLVIGLIANIIRGLNDSTREFDDQIDHPIFELQRVETSSVETLVEGFVS